MRPHAAGMTGETREMQEMRRLPKSYIRVSSEELAFLILSERFENPSDFLT